MMLWRFQKRNSGLLASVAGGALLALLSGSVVQAGLEPDGELAHIRERLEKANQQTARTLGELKALHARIHEVTGRIEGEEAELSAIRSRIRDAQTRSNELQDRLSEAKTARNIRARQMYKEGPATIIAALFAVRAMTDLPKLYVFWGSVAEEDTRSTAELTSLKEKLQEEKDSLDESSDAVTRRAEGLKKMQQSLKSSRNQRTASLGSLRRSIVEAMAAEKALLAARAAAEAAKAAQQKAAATARPSPGPCVPGKPAKDQRLAALLSWYAPAAGPEPFMPPKLAPTEVVFEGVTSWYGPGFEGCATASGATFRSTQMTAASLSLPLGTLLKVTNGGKSVVVVITDRGPYVQGRQLDLSRSAAAAIGASGAASVRMEVVLPSEPAPPFP